MKKSIYIFIGYISLVIFSSCSTAISVSFFCDRDDLNIYVNDMFIGNGLVRYSVPKDVTTAVVECKKDGITIYTETYNVKGHNNELFEIHIPNYNSYSSDRIIHSK